MIKALSVEPPNVKAEKHRNKYSGSQEERGDCEIMKQGMNNGMTEKNERNGEECLA